MDKKYELTDETMEYIGHVLHRIVALKDFGDVKKGDKGGWVESEGNLDQDGNCWVADDAKVYGEAQVSGKALVFGKARVYGYAVVYEEAVVHGASHVYGNALVCGNATVCRDAHVYGDAQVFGNARVFGAAHVYDEAKVYGDARVCGNAEVYETARVRGNVCGNAQVFGNVRVIDGAILRTGITNSEDDYVVRGPQGSRHSYATYHIPSDTVCTGCFAGTLKEFEEAVEKTHKNNAKYLRQYKLVISVFNTYRSHYGAGQSEAKQ